MYCDGFDEIFMINRRNDELLYRDPYPWKGSSTKKGNNSKAITKRRKKNKNKKTHR